MSDHRQINLRCSGRRNYRGRPTVILEAGFQSWSFAWAKVQPEIAKTLRVCSYDRAGMGLSDADKRPSVGPAIAADLDLLLRRAAESPPYLFVGHSVGAMYVRLLADRRVAQGRGRDIFGMVLVDPSIEGQFSGQEAQVAATVQRYRACEAAARQHRLPSPRPELAHCTPKAKPNPTGFDRHVAALNAKAGYWFALASEYGALAGTTTRALWRGRQSYGDMPLTVLTADGRGSRDPQQFVAWSALHGALAARALRGRQIIVADSTHLIMRDQPGAVIAAITDMADRR